MHGAPAPLVDSADGQWLAGAYRGPNVCDSGSEESDDLAMVKGGRKRRIEEWE